jgi:hypothetical protein
MHEYDAALKLTLRDVDVALRQLTGTAIARWLNVELPQVRSARVDMLGEGETGELIHIELQATNDRAMPLRMLDYCLHIYRQLNRFPIQIVLYAGEAPLNMEAVLSGAALSFSYRLVDTRDLDGERLLDSAHIGDNIVAILTRLPDVRGAVHRVVERIADLPGEARDTAFAQLFILAGLRRLGDVIREEARKMPILIDILDHDVIGPEYRRRVEEGIQQGIQQGVQQGVQRGLQQGVQQGELKILRRQIEKRFGKLPEWAEERLASRTAVELEELGLRMLDAPSLEDLLK